MIRIFIRNEHDLLIIVISYWNFRLTVCTTFIWFIAIIKWGPRFFDCCSVDFNAGFGGKTRSQAFTKTTTTMVSNPWTHGWVFILWTSIKEHLHAFTAMIIRIKDKRRVSIKVLLVEDRTFSSSRSVSMIVMVMYLIISEFWCWYSRYYSTPLPFTVRVPIIASLIWVCGVNFNYYEWPRLQPFAPCSSHFPTNRAYFIGMIDRWGKRADRVWVSWVESLQGSFLWCRNSHLHIFISRCYNYLFILRSLTRTFTDHCKTWS